jgi:very-short-patch-repair endonuclease
VTHCVTTDELLAAAPGRPGAARVRAALGDGPAPTRFPPERTLQKLLARAGLPRPRTNVRVHGVEVDALWHDQRLVAEVDGHAAHGTRRAFERDRARDAQLVAHGYRVVRFTTHQLEGECERVVAVIAAALAPTPPAPPRAGR